MSDLSIKLNIAGRVYPLTINRSEEEAIRKAAKRVDESVKIFQQNYAVRDKQDLLAMTALQLASQGLKENKAEISEIPADDFQMLNNLLDEYL